MKLTDEQIELILEDWQENPDSKESKLRLLAAFVQKVSPIVGFEPQGEVIADLMDWAKDAHIEQCKECAMVDGALKMLRQEMENQRGEAKVN